MKQYPSINGHISDVPVIAFDKVDGSNVRAEWFRKHKAFRKFGRRNGLLDDSTPILGKSGLLMTEKYEKDLTDVFLRAGFERVICFFEFLGPRSFAGVHHPEDEHEVILLDINPHKKGILGPREFVKLCGYLDIPRVLMDGAVNDTFVRSVKEGTLEGMTFEGVVCKPKKQMSHGMSMFKIKNEAWVERVKGLYGADENKLIELL